jgi:hypothetical protein
MCNTIDNSINNNNLKGNVTLEDLASPEGYAAFCQLCSDNNKVPMSYESWVDVLEVEDKSDLKFYNPGVSVGSGLAAAQGFLNSVGITTGTQEQILRSAGQRLKTEFNRRASATASKIYQKVDTSGDDGGTSEANYVGGTPFNPSGLSLKNKPIDTNFDTDIRFIGADRYFLDGYDKNTPLLIKCGTPGIIDKVAGDIQVLAYFNDVICNRFRREIAQKVTYNTKVTELFSNDNITVYINNTIQALCMYYFVMSIVAYTDDPRNKNQAMDNLANGFSPTDTQNIRILERMVRQSVLPPFLHKFCFHMMGNYKQSHMPGSPLLKVMPWVFGTSTTESFTTFGVKQGLGPIISAIDGLKMISYTADVLGKACPHWVDFEPYQYTSNPRFDANYNTFWTNGAYITTQGSSTVDDYNSIRFPYSADSAGGITWNSDTDAPDGWVQAMQEVTYVNSEEETVNGPGLFGPNVVQIDGSLSSAAGKYMISGDVDQQQTTCVVFDNSSTDRGYLDVSKHQRYQSLAKNTYSTSWLSSTYHSHQKFGSSLIELQDVETIKPSVFAWLDLYVSDFKELSNGSSSQNSFRGKKMSKKFAGSKDKS